MGILTFQKLGQLGRLGNQFFQYAFALAYAKRHNLELRLPAWKYAKHFKATFPQGEASDLTTIKEEAFHYTDYSSLDHSLNLNFEGYFQSERYFSDYQGLIQKQLMFDPDFVEQVRKPYAEAFTKRTIAIHARRGDYLQNSNYVNLPVSYYLKALTENFPNWKGCNLVFFSDGMDWLKVHFGCLPNAYFVEGKSDIEDLCLMSQCSDFLIANSSFSWWAAWLGEKPGTKIVRPAQHFAGGLAERCDLKDYYPERWTVCDHENYRIDLSDVTFLIPVHRDHNDREENLSLNIQHLQKHFNTNIIVGEQGTSAFEKYVPPGQVYVKFPYADFWRTRMVNEIAAISETPIIAIWDADIILPPMQVWLSVERIRDGADVAYPYESRFVRLPRANWLRPLKKSLDIGIVGGINFPLIRKGDASSKGGAVFFNKQSFFAAGGENQYLISFAPDDACRYHRFTTLGYRVERVPGSLYHLQHFCGLNSGTNHCHINSNREEWHKVSAMSKEQLEKYIETWAWKHSEKVDNVNIS